MKHLSIKTQMIFKLLEKMKYGHIKLEIENKGQFEFGDGPFVSNVFINSESVLFSILNQGDIGFAEAIIDNKMKLSNTSEFIKWICLNDELLKKTLHGNIFGTFFYRVQRWLSQNSIQGAKKNIMAHYDLGNDFYNSWLDSTMTYSSALFNENIFSSEDLTVAQLRKYDRIIEKLEITSSDRILEIGCGWGGFFSRAIQKTGCHVTAVMNSPAQFEYNKNLIQKNNLQSNVELKLTDYRQIEGVYDKIVSIEMIEAVGEKYWPSYFNKIKKCLKNNGAAMIQSITINDNRFDEYRTSTDFIKQYVFPGGMLLSNNTLNQQAKMAALKSENPFEFGLSYAETIKRWKQGFNQAIQNQQLKNLDARFIRLWNLYLVIGPHC